jgi:hypothetical protein
MGHRRRICVVEFRILYLSSLDIKMIHHGRIDERYIQYIPGKWEFKKKNSMVWVRERTIPTERPPLVGEVISNLCG